MRKSVALFWLRMLFLAAGVVVIVSLVRHLGTQQLLAVLGSGLRWFPLLLLLEFSQLALDAAASYYAYGERAKAIPLPVLARAQLIGTAVASMVPAGRTAEEATKAALLTPWAGGGPSVAAGATNQAVTLAVNGLISIPCAVASWVLTGFSWITYFLIIHAVVLVLLGGLMRGGMRAPRIGAWLKRHFSRLGHFTDAFQSTARVGAVLPLRPTLALFSGRVIQVIQYGLMLHATGVDPGVMQVLLAQGINLMALAVGSFVPGQLGVADALFVLTGSLIGASGPQAMAVALQGHLLQVCIIVSGLLASVIWRVRAPVRA